MSSTDAPWSGEVRVSAPGKVILHGEHSVVYGKRAVALSLDLRTHLTVSAAADSVSLCLPDVEINKTWALEELRALWEQMGCTQAADAAPLADAQAATLRKFLGIEADAGSPPRKLALLSFLHLYLAILPQPLPLQISVNSQLPTGAGLGSSAAYAVCLSGALLHIAGRLEPGEDQANLEKVCQWAFRSEQIIHGTPSGIDNSICTYGGAVNFKGGTSTPVEVPPLRVLLVNTKVPRSTKALVTGVRERRERHPSVIDPILDALDSLAERGIQALHDLASAARDQGRAAAHETIGELMEINHSLLCALGVSHPSLDRLVGLARASGLRGKLTGAGGGGFGIVVEGLCGGEDVAKCCLDLESHGYQVWRTCLGAPGFTIHHAQ
ncbi:mevalonate kinase-like [Penaeus chinensis]|uniref:mevalonate kinase-like n=1 Tax=Penaeus chinensis TaxID=139456 RepID=UPI001FB852A9|nr:mevalonate kinase-like [Penaeus chinensis]